VYESMSRTFAYTQELELEIHTCVEMDKTDTL
jgi:hypothetical protein